MNSYDQHTIQTQQADSLMAKNRVLRNTYLLLAISMIPTVLGAVLALQLNLFSNLNPWVSTLIFFAGAFGLMFLVEKNRNNAAGVGFLLLFTFFMGMMLSRILSYTLALNNGENVIAMAFGSTAIIFGVMATIASTSKRDFSFLGKTLFMGVIVLILAAIANLFFQIPALSLAISAAATVIFSLYILFDVQRIVNGGETSYISATLALYLDIYNIFQSLLHIFGVIGGDD
ncbi:Bax inhibitor-1/YccA family protein [Pelistega sp. NLN82]|uniref:Bax inhibitor-1/YccA family protein n=1 Tax=Pelistega ratti TaxID=2652177 RepID=A0A6L9Y5R1_9BURK|nr:Bax inhibitor-1/YccA family protein [Pelistega ratti]NEN75683.1 Bax inhibitor-1/YccA family protein [Pelistega ratti]